MIKINALNEGSRGQVKWTNGMTREKVYAIGRYRKISRRRQLSYSTNKENRYIVGIHILLSVMFLMHHTVYLCY